MKSVLAILMASAILAAPVMAEPLDLIWDAPTRNTDDSALTNLVGYVVYVSEGTNAEYQVDVLNPAPGVTLTNAPDTTIRAQVSAVNARGLLSDRSPAHIVHRERPEAISRILSSSTGLVVEADIRVRFSITQQ